jgi:hypothetical protein
VSSDNLLFLYYTPRSSSQRAKNVFHTAIGAQAVFLYYNILISSLTATISWWDRQFRLSPPALCAAIRHK